MLWALAALCALLLAGCGGGGGQPLVADGGLAGAWLQVTTDLPALHPDEPTLWRTRLLGLTADGGFSCEEGLPLATTDGGFVAQPPRLALFPRRQTGMPQRFGVDELTYAQYENRLVLSAEVPDGPVRTFNLARTASFTPPALCTDWLLARRHTREGAELPCLHAVRMSIADDGSITLRRGPADGLAHTWQGRLLVADGGVLGVRVTPTATDPGGVLLLGGGRTQAGALVIEQPDGVTATYSPRIAPVRDLVGRWRDKATGSADTLDLASDGRCTLTTAGITRTGTWRCHYGGYLALDSADQVLTLAWSLRGTVSPTLTTGQWVPHDGGPATFVQTTWGRMTAE